MKTSIKIAIGFAVAWAISTILMINFSPKDLEAFSKMDRQETQELLYWATLLQVLSFVFIFAALVALAIGIFTDPK